MNSSAMYMYGLPVKSDAVYMEETLPFSDNSMASSYISGSQHSFHGGYCNSSSFADDIYVPNEVVEELEWLSNFMEDSTPYHSAAVNINQGGPALVGNNFGSDYRRSKKKVEEEMVAVQRCTHCAAEKTPQWRTGPQGPKTLCNACGVRYKSGRLVPEYRPANSPTFVQSQHSNSHRKVMELRRQKEQRLSVLR